MTTNVTKTKLEAVQNSSKQIRVLTSLYDKLEKQKDTLSKESCGSRPIKINQILELAISKLDKADFEHLKSLSVSNLDRQNEAFRVYRKKHRDVSKDDFLGLIQTGTVQLKDYLSSSHL